MGPRIHEKRKKDENLNDTVVHLDFFSTLKFNVLGEKACKNSECPYRTAAYIYWLQGRRDYPWVRQACLVNYSRVHKRIFRDNVGY